MRGRGERGRGRGGKGEREGGERGRGGCCTFLVHPHLEKQSEMSDAPFEEILEAFKMIKKQKNTDMLHLYCDIQCHNIPSNSSQIASASPSKRVENFTTFFNHSNHMPCCIFQTFLKQFTGSQTAKDLGILTCRSAITTMLS